MKMRILLATAAVLTAPVALAQTQTDTPAATAGTAQMQTISAEQFVQMAAVSNMFEIQSSEIATETSQSEPVQQFAQHMIEDHTAAGEKMRQAVEASGQDYTIPEDLDERHQQMVEQLQGIEGDEFDQAYVDMQVQAHEEAVALFQAFAETGEDEALQSFAQETLPTFQQHYEMIQEMDRM